MWDVKLTFCHFSIENGKLSFFHSKQSASLEKEEDIDLLVAKIFKSRDDLLWVSYGCSCHDKDSDTYSGDVIYAKSLELAEP